MKLKHSMSLWNAESGHMTLKLKSYWSVKFSCKMNKKKIKLDS